MALPTRYRRNNPQQFTPHSETKVVHNTMEELFCKYDM